MGNISMNDSLETYLHEMGVNIPKPFILLTMRTVYNIACSALCARIYSKYKIVQKNRIIANVALRH